jgi:flagellar hook-associated protein 3 FlgL
MSIQQVFFDSQIRTLEYVDSVEAATRVNSLMTQIETAYTLTSRLNRLTLSNYL